MTAKVVKITASWTSAACSCCPPDMVEAIVLLSSGEQTTITTTLCNVGDEVIFDKDEDEEFWIPLN